MKNYLPFILAFAALISLANQEAYSQKHIVNVGDFYFEPSNLTVEVGDTIRWVWIEGQHTTTSTTIPSGAQSWGSPITSAVTSFEYRVEMAGVYNYHCVLHSSIQTAQFTAVSTLSVNNKELSNFNVYPNPSTGVFNITTYSNKLQTGKTTIRVFDTKGNLVYDEVKTNFLSGKVDLSKMTRGTYLIQLENKDQIYTNRVALIE